MADSDRTAKIETKTAFAGGGCVVQALGLAVVWIWPLGTIVGVALLLIGSRMAIYPVCSACKSKLPDKRAEVCWKCGASFRR